MISNIKDAMKVASIIFAVVFVLFLMFGLQEGLRDSETCLKSPARVELFMPGFQLGCWLAQRGA